MQTFEDFMGQVRGFVSPLVGEENPIDYLLREAAAALESTQETFVMARIGKANPKDVAPWAGRVAALMYQVAASVDAIGKEDPQELLSAVQAAKMLGTTRQNISLLVQNGQLEVRLRKLRDPHKGGRKCTYYYREDIARLAAAGVGKRK